MLSTTPAIESFINNEHLLLALFITELIIWIIAISIILKARSLRKDNKAIITEYEPPKELSPVFARFIMVSGREGGISGEISKTGNQLLTMINLYEDGLLKKLEMIDEKTLEYEVHENYKNLECSEEEKVFLEKLIKNIGTTGKLQETEDSKSNIDGYLNLNDLWFDFWHKDLYQLARSRGYMEKESKLVFALSLFSGSLTFGMFFSVFLSFIPFVGWFIALLLLLPVLLVFAVGYGISSLILMNFDFSWALNDGAQAIILFFGLFSWFAWFIIFGQNMSIIYNKLTPKGLELVRKLKGYKSYLKSVDKDRLSFSFNRDNDFSRNRTSFSWLGVFGLIKDKHWDEWYEIAKKDNKFKAPKTIIG